MQDASQTALEKGQRLYIITILSSDVETLPTHLLGLISTHLPLSSHTSQVSKMIHLDHGQVSLSLTVDRLTWVTQVLPVTFYRKLRLEILLLCSVCCLDLYQHEHPSLITHHRHGWIFSFHRTQKILRRKF